MKKFLFVVLILIACTLSVTASEWSFGGEGGLYTRYVWRGLRLSDGFVFQASGWVKYYGFKFTAWQNTDFQQEKMNEVDTTVSYTHEFSKDLSLEGGWIHYGKLQRRHDTDELFGSVTYTGWPVVLNAKIFADVNYGEGVYLQAQALKLFVLTTDMGLQVSASAGFNLKDSWLGYDKYGKDFSNFYDGNLTVALPVNIGKGWTMEPSVSFAFPLSSDAKYVFKHEVYGSQATTLYGGLVFRFNR